MSYTCRVYSDTGFNAVNGPDTPALLDSGVYFDAQALAIVQDRELTSIRIRATYQAVKNADYVRVGDWYYSIPDHGIHMTSEGDVAEIQLIPDYALSAGGFQSLTYLDGITERVCVAEDDDVYGRYTQPDELTAPSEPLRLVSHWYDPRVEGDDQYYTIVESTIDLAGTGDDATAVTYSDGAGGTVTVPVPTQLSSYTNYDYSGQHGTASYIKGYSTELDALIQRGINRARALGVESAIISQYQLPRAYMGGTVVADSALALLTGATIDDIDTGIPYRQGAVKNLRALYGEYTRYGLLTTSGNRVEFAAEDIYNQDKTNPTISVRADITSSGCPYFRFTDYLGQGADGSDFWQNAVAGSEWRQVPLVYQGESGSSINRLVYDTQRETAASELALSKAQLQYQFAEGATNAVFGGAGQYAMSGALVGGPIGAVGGAIAGATLGLLQAGQSWRQTEHQMGILDQQYALQARSELTSYMAQHEVVAPQITFPYNSSIMRDAMHNGVVIYRYQYSDADLARVDRLLTMYGYRHTKAIDRTDFTNRPRFNYVKAHGVSIAGLPRWWADGIARQLAAGIRVWHETPSVGAYSDNTGGD